MGTPTILINNAGIVHGKSLLDLSPDEIDRYVHLSFSLLLFLSINPFSSFLPSRFPSPLNFFFSLQNLPFVSDGRHQRNISKHQTISITLENHTNPSTISLLIHLCMCNVMWREKSDFWMSTYSFEESEINE